MWVPELRHLHGVTSKLTSNPPCVRNAFCWVLLYEQRCLIGRLDPILPNLELSLFPHARSLSLVESMLFPLVLLPKPVIRFVGRICKVEDRFQNSPVENSIAYLTIPCSFRSLPPSVVAMMLKASPTLSRNCRIASLDLPQSTTTCTVPQVPLLCKHTYCRW